MHGEAVQDYLKAIYQLGAAGDGAPDAGEPARVGTQELADLVRVAPASASKMLQRLAKLGLVEYEPYRGASLTPEGEKAALEVVRHHRLLELYLHDVLGYGRDEVHAEAEKLEHHISEQLEARIFEALGRPVVDPHGDVIPAEDGSLPGEDEAAPGRPLAGAVVGSSFVVRRIPSADVEKLRYLQGAGLVPGARVCVLEVYPFEGGLRLQVEGARCPLTLGQVLAGEIAVSAAPAEQPAGAR